jgi:hypothetical protein
MGHIHAISIREKSLPSVLLLPFARAATVRLSGAAARLATLLRRAGACSPRRAAAGLLRHAGSAALLAATLRAWTLALLGLRWRTAPLLRATAALLRGWTSALLGLRRRTAPLLRATAALLRAWTSALLDLRLPLLRPTAALLRRARGSALLYAAFTLWRRNASALLRPSFRLCGWLLAT